MPKRAPACGPVRRAAEWLTPASRAILVGTSAYFPFDTHFRQYGRLLVLP